MKLNLIKALLPALFFTQITLAEEVVNFYNWADYIGESTIRDFEKEFGIKVNYDEYDSSEIVEAKLLAGNSGYDLVVHSSMYSKRLMPLKIFHEIDPQSFQTMNVSIQCSWRCWMRLIREIKS